MDMTAYAALGVLERITIIVGAILIGYWGYRLYQAERPAGLVFMSAAALVLALALVVGSWQATSRAPLPELALEQQADARSGPPLTLHAPAAEPLAESGTGSGPATAGSARDAGAEAGLTATEPGVAPGTVVVPGTAGIPGTTDTPGTSDGEPGTSPDSPGSHRSQATEADGAMISKLEEAGTGEDDQPSATGPDRLSKTEPVPERPRRLASGAELGGRIVSVRSENVILEWSEDSD